MGSDCAEDVSNVLYCVEGDREWVSEPPVIEGIDIPSALHNASIIAVMYLRSMLMPPDWGIKASSYIVDERSETNGWTDTYNLLIT